MAQYVKIPLINPFKFLPATQEPGIHFDDDWACAQIKSFERNVRYFQKWEGADQTYLQIESTIAPNDLKVYDRNMQEVKSIAWTNTFAGGLGYGVYQTIFSLSGLTDGIYFLYQKVVLSDLVFQAISEPIHYTAGHHKNTLLFKYRHRFNDYGIIWGTNGFNQVNSIFMQFRCEAGIMDFQPERERTAYVNQNYETATLHGIASRSFKLYIGEAPGVAPYVLDILNRIFLCSYISIEGKQYQSTEGSKWEISRAKGYPLIGGAIEITEAFSNDALEFSELQPDGTGGGPGVGGSPNVGIVTSYNIETAVFGGGSLVPIQDVEKQS